MLQHPLFSQINLLCANPDSVRIHFKADISIIHNNGAVVLSSSNSQYIPFAGQALLPVWDFYVISETAPVLDEVLVADSSLYENAVFEIAQASPVQPAIESGNEIVDIFSAVEVSGRKMWKITISPFGADTASGCLLVYDELVITLLVSNAQKNTLPIHENPLWRKAVNYKPRLLKSDKPEQKSMLIVCPRFFSDQIATFLEWKKKKGLQVYDEYIDSDISYADVQKLVQTYYEKSGIDFVLLIGDYEQIPPVPVYGYSDNMYGCVEGDDYYPEIIVGRICADNITDLNKQLKKTLAYETGSLFSDTVSFKNSACFIASKETVGQGNVYDYEHLRELRGYYQNESFQVQELFDGSQMEIDSPGNPMDFEVADAFTSGLSILYYTGHGTDTSLLTSRFSNSDVSTLENTAQFPLGVISGCRLGAFKTKSCLAERLMNAGSEDAPAGFVAALASTQDQWWLPPILGQRVFAYEHLGVSRARKSCLGEIIASVFLEVISTYGVYGDETVANWSVFGDPSLEIFSQQPHGLSLSLPSNLTLGDRSVSVEVAPEACWLVCSQNGKVLFADSVDAGSHVLAIDPVASPDPVFITASARDCYTYYDSLNVEAGDSPFFAIDEVSVVSDSFAVAGEFVEFDAVLKNIGFPFSGPVSVRFHSDDVGDIIPEQSVSVIDSFGSLKTVGVHIPENVQNGSDLQFTLIIDHLAFTQEVELLLPVHAPELLMKGMDVLPTEFSEPSMVVSEGELRTAVFWLANVSDVPAENFEFVIDPPLSYRFVQKHFDVSLPPNSDSLLRVGFLLDDDSAVTKTDQLQCSLQYAGQSAEGYFPLHRTSSCVSFERKTAQLVAGTNWTVSADFANTGGFSLRSDEIDDNQSSSYVLIVDFDKADSLGFWFRTSCEEAYYIGQEKYMTDYLSFLVDGTELASWGGQNPWGHFSVPVSAGQHIFEWQYFKDFAVSENDDAVWIDDIYWGGSSLHKTVEQSARVLQCKGTAGAFELSKNALADSLLFLPESAFVDDNVLYFDCGAYDDLFYYVYRANDSLHKQAFTVEKTVSLVPSEKNTPQAYPTIAGEYIYLSAETDVYFQIVNSMGTACMNGFVNAGSNQLDVSRLASGWYIIRLQERLLWFYKE